MGPEKKRYGENSINLQILTYNMRNTGLSVSFYKKVSE